MDKAFWQRVAAADYAVPEGHAVMALTGALLGFLGSADAELRDEIGYGVFWRWLDAGHYSPDDLRGLLKTLQDNLTAGVGEQDTDTVFLRAFSVLWLAAIVYYDNHAQPFLTDAELRDLTTSALAYFHDERDLRGYIPGKGWAHSCAHTADLLDELVQNRHFGSAAIARVLAAIADKALAPTGIVYRYDEDERLAVAVVSAFARAEIAAAHVAAWLAQFDTWQAAHPRYSYFDDPRLYSAYLNAKNVLRSVYVRLNGTADLPDAARAYAPQVLVTLKAYSLRM